jgi:hypothetical protein
MDFLDPVKIRRHKYRLISGYVLLGIAIFLTTVVLIFLSFGYGVGKGGQIIQNGLVFVSSQPNPAQINLNGNNSGSGTNARLQLPAGQYTLSLTKTGYRPWVRSVGVEGGSVEHFDYPFLFPVALNPTTVEQYASQPALVLQSPNQRWVLIAKVGSNTDFDEYDLNSPKTLSATLTTVSIPSTLLSDPTASQTMTLVGWSADNNHVLLLDSYSGGSDYILLDRTTPSNSLNLTKQLNLTSTDQLSLINKAYDSYYIWDSSTSVLSSATLTNLTPVTLISHVLNYDSYGTNMILYATTSATAGEVDINLYNSGQIFNLRRVNADPPYLLNFTQYGGKWYYAIGDTGNDKIYIYQNPIQALRNQSGQPIIPVYIMKLAGANFLQFSTNTQFIAAESGDNFAVYDAENANGYAYSLTQPLAAGQHASWMDGDRLMLTSDDHVVIFDYDHANLQTLQPAIDQSAPLFNPSFSYMYTLADAPLVAGVAAASVNFTSTTMLAP